jgi:hypothetical protein
MSDFMMIMLMKAQEKKRQMKAVRERLVAAVEQQTPWRACPDEGGFTTQFTSGDKILSISCPVDWEGFEVWVKGSEREPSSCGTFDAVMKAVTSWTE